MPELNPIEAAEDLREFQAGESAEDSPSASTPGEEAGFLWGKKVATHIYYPADNSGGVYVYRAGPTNPAPWRMAENGYNSKAKVDEPITIAEAMLLHNVTELTEGAKKFLLVPQDSIDLPKTLPIELMAGCLSALVNTFGRFQGNLAGHSMTAIKHTDNQVVLTIQDYKGNDRVLLITLPLAYKIDAEVFQPEEEE